MAAAEDASAADPPVQSGEVTAKPKLLVFGGSFNPPHIGHLRAMVEIKEQLNVGHALFLPSSIPPHKGCRGLLPFAFRCELLRAAIKDMGEAARGIEVCALEGERPGPSYSVDTLRELAGLNAEARLAFVLGSDEYAGMGRWPGRQEIAQLADIIVMARLDGAEAVFDNASRALWPEAKPSAGSNGRKLLLPQGGTIVFVPLPRIEISATRVRQRFLEGQSVEMLLPPRVLAYLRGHREFVCDIWAS